MKALLPLLIIQIFGIALNIPAKELPLYGEVEINDKENFFLKSDLFKIGKKVEFIIYFSFQKMQPHNPFIYIDYCFSDQNEDYTCLKELKSYNDFHFVEEKPENITVRYNNIFLTMEEKKYKYLLLRVRVDEDYVPLSLKIVHDPYSGINGKSLLGEYQQINLDENQYFYYEADRALQNKEDEIEVQVAFNSTDKYDSLIIYYDNQNKIQEEYTENLSKNITTDFKKKENDQYTFYFYLPLYNFTKKYVEYNYVVFRPQSVGNNVSISGMWSSFVSKKVPTYGTLVEENMKNGLYYLNIENLEKGDNIYLQITINNYDSKYLDISYSFTDENFNEMFSNRKDFNDKKEKDGITTFYLSIDVERKAKFFLFHVIVNSDQQNIGNKITVKQTEKNEYTNTTLIIIIVIFVIVIIIAIAVLFILRSRKNKVSSSDIENVSSLSA